MNVFSIMVAVSVASFSVSKARGLNIQYYYSERIRENPQIQQQGHFYLVPILPILDKTFIPFPLLNSNQQQILGFVKNTLRDLFGIK